MNPIGFSDLTDNEAFILKMFRDWSCMPDEKSVWEDKIAFTLRNDVLSGVLSTIFDTFRQISAGKMAPCGTDSIISPIEEQLLDVLAEKLSKLENSPTACASRDRIVRETAGIERSGRDQLLKQVDEAYWQFARLQS